MSDLVCAGDAETKKPTLPSAAPECSPLRSRNDDEIDGLRADDYDEDLLQQAINEQLPAQLVLSNNKSRFDQS